MSFIAKLDENNAFVSFICLWLVLEINMSSTYKYMIVLLLDSSISYINTYPNGLTHQLVI